MNGLVDLIRTLEADNVRQWVHAGVAIVLGIVLAGFVVRWLNAAPVSAQQRLLLKRLSSAVIMGVALAWSLAELGLNLGVLLGAAGVLTVALGFAAQTSVSNLISGLFLIAEQPFVVGDVIQVDTATGEVISIDMISVKIRTFDNVLVRIPNETMLKANVRNMTHFPIRRLDMQIGVAYREDLQRVTALLLQLADRSPLALRDPAPQVFVQAYGDSSVNLQFSMWVRRERLIELKNAMHHEVKRAFDEAGIEIPFPHRTIVTRIEPAAAPESGARDT